MSAEPEAPGQVTPEGSGPSERRLLAFSADRTVWLCRENDDSRVVRKVYERGDRRDAEREFTAGRRLAGPGFARYLRVETEAGSERPCVVLQEERGLDLDRLVRRQGPLPSQRVAACGVALASVLVRVHRFGVHGDVKPGNLLLAENGEGREPEVVLLDAEHVTLGEAPPERSGFSGGTHGWSPPEAYRGAPATPAFDVFGLGATLWFVATGCAPFPRAAREATPPTTPRAPAAHLVSGRLRELLMQCLSPDPRQRPPLADVRTRLEALRAGSPLHADLDAIAAAACAGDLDAVQLGLETLDVGRADEGDATRIEALAAFVRRQRRALARRSLPHTAGTLDLPVLTHTAAHAVAWLRRFPGSAHLHEVIATLRVRLAAELDALPGLLAEAKRCARFAPALALLDQAAAAIAILLPVGGPRPELPPGTAPSPWQRSPLRLLALSRDDLRAAAEQHAAVVADVDLAEAALNLADATRAVEHSAAVYSGASEVVAGLKDRVHRLTFYLERLAQPDETVRQLADELEAVGLPARIGELARLLQHCREQTAGGPSTRGVLGLRALARTLAELSDELPATSRATDTAAGVLRDAMDALSQHAWLSLDDARKKLDSVPIPIRPLQNLVARLDHLRLIDALIDSPRGTRAELLDDIERLRMDLDRARAARDRLASGAREAMERGHLTTALYDMARVADRYADAPASDLEEVRQKKQDVETAQRDNHRLAARYAELEDDATSRADDRLAVLGERLRVLRFLADSVARERAGAYAQDVLDVEVRIEQERTAEVERTLDATTDPLARAELARRTLRELSDFAAARAGDVERLGRVQRAVEHWQSLCARAETDVARLEAAAAEARRHRARSRLAKAAVATLALALAVTLFFLLQRGGDRDPVTQAADALRDQLRQTPTAVGFEPVRTALALDRFTNDLERSGIAATGPADRRELLAKMRELAGAVAGCGQRPLPAGWGSNLDGARLRLAAALAAVDLGTTEAGAVVREAVARFVRHAEIAAVLTAAHGPAEEQRLAAVRAYAAAHGLGDVLPE